MRHRYYYACLVVFALLISLTGYKPTYGQSRPFKPGEVLVQLEDSKWIDEINQRYGTKVISVLPGSNTFQLQIPKNVSTAQFSSQLAQDPMVKNAKLNLLVKTPSVKTFQTTRSFPNDTPELGKRTDLVTYFRQDAKFLLELDKIQMDGKGVLGRGVKVAIIDTGIDPYHRLLTNRISSDSYDFVGEGDADPSEDTVGDAAGHGTFVAGIVTLAAPGAEIMVLRTMNGDGVGTEASVTRAIYYAIEHGAQVINLSFGTDVESTLIRDALTMAHNMGIVLVAAAGNSNSSDNPPFPASRGKDLVISVAATTIADRKTEFSNYGKFITVCAPGENIVSTFLTRNVGNQRVDTYARWSGTSFAAPWVTGLAALLFEFNPRASAKQVNNYIKFGAKDIFFNNDIDFIGQLGRGRINPVSSIVVATDKLNWEK